MKRVGFLQLIIGCFLLIPTKKLIAQSSRVLPLESFIQQLKQFHPLAKQAKLVTEMSAANLLAVRGEFDPVFDMSADNKTLDGTNYYRYQNPELQLPTVLGIKFKTGIENSSGQFKNPELTTGVASYVGIEVPLLKGLLIDKKRAALQQARIYNQQSEQERRAAINDLLYSAYVSYWEWASAYQIYQIYNKYVQLADKRLQLIHIGFRNGDKSEADTIEAFTQLQNYRLMQGDALINLNNKVLDLSQFLWLDNGEPYLLPPYFRPDTTQFSIAFPLPDTAGIFHQLRTMHPLLQITQLKLKSLDVERRLKFQGLLPTTDVSANILSKDYYNFKDVSSYYLENNYKLGINISVPLLFRQGRGAYRNIKLKIKDIQLEFDRKTWEQETTFRRYYNEALQLRNQVSAASSAYESYQSLLNIEALRFSQGESSLFVVNSRENKALEMQQKVIELLAKYIKAIYAAQWAAAALLPAIE